MSRTILVTGGAGFIGNAVVRALTADGVTKVVNVDKLTYAASPAVLDMLAGPRHHLVHADVCDSAVMAHTFSQWRPDALVHLAAETHVDRSIDGPSSFIATNIVGTATLLDAAKDYWSRLSGSAQATFRFVHVSTDEVFGTLGREGAFAAADPYRPRSPYAASKASSDHLVRAWHTTYGLPTLVTHGSNTYGPWQFPEKLIPRAIIRGLAGRSIEVYGRGENVRDWLHVDDHAAGIVRALDRGVPGASYLIGGKNERRNIDLVTAVCDSLDRQAPRGNGSYRDLIALVADRPGHDYRYALDTTATEEELRWSPGVALADGLDATVQWYIENRGWWQAASANTYSGERLGLAVARRNS